MFCELGSTKFDVSVDLDLEPVDLRLEWPQLTFGLKKKFKFYVPGFYFRYSLKKLRTNSCFFNSDEEKFMVTSVESAHDLGSFKGLRLKHNLLTYETVQLINQSSVKPYVIKSKLLSDVIGIVAFVIDSDSLKNCLDSGI